MINRDLFQGCKGGSTFRSKSRQYTNHINQIKHKNHMVTSVDTERAFDKIQHLFMFKKTFNSEYRRGCSRAAAPVCGFSRGTTARSVSLSWGAREVGSPGSGEGERVTGPEPW